MRLLFVLPEYGVEARGGIATFYAQLLPALVRAGCEVDVCVAIEPVAGQPATASGDDGITVRAIGPGEAARARARTRHLAATPGVRHALALAYAAWETCRRGEDYDVVETTDFGLLFAPWLAAGEGPPVVVQLHGSSGQVDYYDPMAGNELTGLVTRLLETSLLGRAEELQAYGTPNGSAWKRLLCRPVQVIPPTWSVAPPSAAGVPGALDVGNAGVVVGRLQDWKGPETLCEALGLLGDDAPRVFWIGRDNPYRQLGRPMSSHLQRAHADVWGTRIVPAGEYSRDVVAAIQRAARFVVVPSLWDTMNLAAIEAMAEAKVVVCSDGAGAVDLIDDGVNGFRFAAGDAGALASAIARAAAMADDARVEMGARAKRAVLERLAPEATLPRRLERYDALRVRGRRREASPWAEQLFGPGTRLATEDFGFLDQLPLRPVVSHARARVLRKARQLLERFGGSQ